VGLPMEEGLKMMLMQMVVIKMASKATVQEVQYQIYQLIQCHRRYCQEEGIEEGTIL
jgi:hypothetical protein